MTGENELKFVSEMMRHLSNSFATAMLYTPEHPLVVTRILHILDPLHQLLSGRNELTFLMTKGEIFHQGKPLVKTSCLKRLAWICAQRGIEHITFSTGVEAADLRQLVRCVAGTESLDVLRNDFSLIRVGRIVTSGEIESDPFTPIESFEQLTSAQLKGLQEVYGNIAQREPLEIQNIATLIGGFVAAFKREANPLMALVPLRNIDDYSFTHSVNVGILNIAQGMSLGIDGQLLHDLGIAGLLHDAGKIFIDREILRKPGVLSEEEWATMKTHPSRGAQYLMEQKGIPTVAVICAYEHHMRYDLSGYPQPPDEWRLNLCSQITMISDTFDALRTRRTYDDSWDFPKTSGRMLEVAGKNLNPDLTLNFLKLLAKMGEGMPPRSLEKNTPLRDNYCE